MGPQYPAPWHWEYHPDTRKPIALSSRGGDILVATGNDVEIWADVSEAHMALLAAAPDLLAAAHAALGILDAKRLVNGAEHDAIKALCAAIAKATRT